MREIYLVAAKRSAIGTFGGSLSGFDPGALGALIARDVLAETGIAPEAVGHAVFGQVIPTAPRDAYLARVVALEAGLPHECPALTVNRLCGSGMQAIVSAAQAISLGDCEIAIAGGAEVMSRAPYFAPAMRWGNRMGDTQLVDGLNGALTDPFGGMLMGVTAENVAERYGIDRTQQDAYAAESQRRAAAAIGAGFFDSQITPVTVRRKREETTFAVDEFVRADATAESLGKLKPIFKRENGSVTAGNASGINDGASAVLLASADAVEKHNLKPMARLLAYGHAGVDPDYMGIGPVPATRNALSRAQITTGDLDIIESNEAFAAQACAVAQELGFDPDKTNPNGSGISLGHPVGATGAIIVTKLVHELARTNGRYGLATMCIGGGQGIATVFERLES